MKVRGESGVRSIRGESRVPMRIWNPKARIEGPGRIENQKSEGGSRVKGPGQI